MSSAKSISRLFAILVIFLSINILQLKNLHSQSSEESSKLKKQLSIKDVLDFSFSIYNGEIFKIEKKFKKEIPVWNIEMVTKNGGSLELEISGGEEKLLEIIADEGPFDYEINPGNEIIPLSAATKTAEEFTSQKVMKWKLTQIKEKYEYDFWLFTKSGKAQVRIDALSGEIITKRNSKKK